MNNNNFYFRDVSDGRHMTRTIIQETHTEMAYPGGPNAGASSATKELDDLMASLSDFKVHYIYDITLAQFLL